MAEENQIQKNLRRGKYIIAITNGITAIIFYLIYDYTGIELILYLAVVLILLAIGIVFYFGKIEKKYTNLKDNE